LWRIEGLVGYTWQPRQTLRFALTPYGGIGYRYWRRGLADSNVETYTWWYGSAGVRADWWRGRWNIAPEAAVRIPFGGNINVDSPFFGSTDLSLGSRPGYIAQLAVMYRFTGNWVARLAGSFEESRIGQSPIQNLLVINGVPVLAIQEPSSKTEQITIGIGVTYVY
jgi:hypothetical protein